MQWLVSLVTVERLGLISVGAVLFGACQWLYFQLHGNRLPKDGEPIIYVEQLTNRLPNGRIYAVSICNSSGAPIWLEELVPRSRAFGRILSIPANTLHNDNKLELDINASAGSAKLHSRVEAGDALKYYFWVGGLEWPIWKFVFNLRWSPYGPAARKLNTIVHCAT